MAFYGLQQDKLTFTKKEISAQCFNSKQIPRNFDGMGLLQISTIGFISSTYQFHHRTVQEFLAAYYLSKQPKLIQQNTLKKLLDNKKINENMEMVWIFFGGLTHFETISVQDLLPNSLAQEACTKFIRGCVCLWKFIGRASFRVSSLKDVVIAYFTTQNYSKYVSEIISRQFQCTLLVAALEAQNPQFCNAICNSYLYYGESCWFTVPDSAVTPQILSALSYVIAHSAKKWIIQCKALSDDGADSLCKHLMYEQCKSGSDHNSYIWALDVHTSASQINGLVKVILTQRFLHWLVLSQSVSLDDDSMIKLCEVLKTNRAIKMLHLLGCDISSVGTKALADLLRWNSTLIWIGLRDNPKITDEDVVLLLDTINHHNSVLTMLWIDNYLAKKPKVKQQLEILNDKRKMDGKEKLWVSLIECLKLCKYFRH